MSSDEPNGEFRVTGRFVLLCLIGFFAVVFAVNGAMLSFALSTNSGGVSQEPYRKGLKYNERIAADEQQALLGWKSDISLDGKSKRLTVILTDHDGKPVEGKAASANVGLAVTDRDDVTAELKETSPGRYEADLKVADAGNFIADLEVKDVKDGSQGVVYRARRRLWVAP